VPAVLRGWRQRQIPVERFLLAWLMPGWVCLELAPSKLPNYPLPLYPALALLAAAALAQGVCITAGHWTRRIELAARGLWAVISLALAAALIGLPVRYGDGPAVLDVIGAALVIGIAVVLVRGRFAAFATAGFCAALSLAFIVPVTAGVVPGLDRLWLSRSAAALVVQHPPAAGRALVAVGYSEPSLVFLLGGEPRLLLPGAAAAALAAGGEALVSDRDEPAFRQALAARGLRAQPRGSVSGLDYSNGKEMVLTLFTVEPR
jgi:4-amino-4-deoxy-L-arabinose transferase-like glycosyltransferase